MASYVVKVHKKGLMVLPAKLRKKYGIREGSEVVLVDEGSQIVLVPRQGLESLYGLAKEHAATIDEMIKELHEERKREASA